jgi:ATP-binding cassette subfamily B protein
VLAMYDMRLLFIFCSGSLVYFLWVRFFLAYRRKINYETFHLAAQENSASLQLIQGMQEIKLHNAEKQKRWEWEGIQAGIFKLDYKNLSLNQLQQSGAMLINEGKNVLITFLVAQMVVRGELTLGAMLAVQYIIGQLNSPVEQFVGFMQNAQDAKISLERLNEIHSLKNEEDIGDGLTATMPDDHSISLHDFSFAYPGSDDTGVLTQINIHIPAGKTTAIVGASGSGKTTLLKLLLKFYNGYDGTISIGDTDFRTISPSFWRSQCGAVLQDGYIFNDTILSNIAVGNSKPDIQRAEAACGMANIMSFIDTLPNRFNTQIGVNGKGISQGQKQRILIARAIYKDPAYLFFDEATNALDTENEKVITENLDAFFNGRTVVVVAHRLSTVKNAHNILVLKEGRIIESGNHATLTALKGSYYTLVKNQLELGN